MKGDLTKGSPMSAVCKFTLPLLLSVAFQQIYSISDSIIVGKFAADGEAALASIGSSYPITMIYMAIGVGCNAGVSVVLSHLFGSRRYKDMKTAASTSIIAASVLSVILTVFGLIFAGDFLKMLNTPENIMGDSTLYLQLFFVGYLLLFLYNIANGIFTALGDSVTPLIFLISSSFANIILNYVFVRFLHLDVFGVALASLITQSAAGILAFVFVIIKLKSFKTEKFKLFSGRMLATLSKYAVPGMLQQSFISVGNLFIQGLVNSFGSSVIAGYSAAIKLNTFCLSSLNTVGTGISAFTAQNIGAGKTDRVKKGTVGITVMACCVGAVFSVACYIFADGLISLFMSKEDMTDLALSAGRDFLRIVAPFYVIGAIKLICDGVLRGGGAMGQFLCATFTDLLLRVILAFTLVSVIPSLEYRAIWVSWPAGWIVATVLSVIFVMSGSWKKGKIM